MEFYLVDDLECDLTVFHPYRTLMTLCSKEGSDVGEAEAGEAGVGIDDGPRYWGTGEGRLEMHEGALQMAWYGSCPECRRTLTLRRFLINDTYRSDLCLLYPPHLIAITAIYMACAVHQETRGDIEKQTQVQPHGVAGSTGAPGSMRRSSRPSSSSFKRQQPQDIVGFLAGLNVNMGLVATIAQEIVALHALWDRYNDDGTMSDAVRASLKRSVKGAILGGTTPSPVGTPVVCGRGEIVTPGFLVPLFWRMREARMSGAHAGPSRAVNKVLERAQAAG